MGAWTIIFRLASVFIEIILWSVNIHEVFNIFFSKQYISPFFPRLLNIYETLNAFSSKPYLDAIGPFSYASSYFYYYS